MFRQNKDVAQISERRLVGDEPREANLRLA